MAQPVLIRESFQVALLTGIQAVIPAGLAAACLYLSIRILELPFKLSAAIVPIVLCLTLIQLPRQIETRLTSARTIAIALTLMRWALVVVELVAIGSLTHVLRRYPPRVYVLWVLTTPVVLTTWLIVMDSSMRRALVHASRHRRAVVAGYNASSLQLMHRLREDPSIRIEFEGFFDDRSGDRLGVEPGARLLGTLTNVASYVKTRGVDVIFIALPISHVQRVLQLLDELRDTTASIYYLPDIFVFDLIQARSGEVNGIPVVAMCETPFFGYRGVAKRLLDIVCASLILVFSSPLLGLIALAVKCTSKGPVIFKQRRYGLDGHEIVVYKFRTMHVTEDGAHVRQACRNDPRTTWIGRFLRRFSLDELPQLLNVLQGRMSLVGPRPHAVAHNEEYRKLIKGYMIRHKVPPGITGLAQINGCRGETTTVAEMEARIRHDLDYLRHWTPLLDIKILWLTVLTVLRDNNAY